MSLLLSLLLPQVGQAGDADEFKIKRESKFALAQKPVVKRVGPNLEIHFATESLCDVTVSIENKSETIIRHLACGVLGANAPDPFTKLSRKQILIWDGKDDQGHYVDDLKNHSVRVSLGLKAEHERSLYWEPKKQMSRRAPLLCAAPEGMYVFDARGVDHLRLFDHKGEYKKTIYPFPAAKLKDVKGLRLREFLQGGRWPLKFSNYQQTLLASGDNASDKDRKGMDGKAASTMAVHGTRIALTRNRLNRLATDGSTAGLNLYGTTDTTVMLQLRGRGNKPYQVSPWSSAFSPDGKWIYYSGYAQRHSPNSDAKGNLLGGEWNCRHFVARMPYATDGKFEIFKGRTGVHDRGTGKEDFHCAAWVACDKNGLVYVADYMNDRIQVFTETGDLKKSIPVKKPAKIQIDPESGDLYVGSWTVHNFKLGRKARMQPTLTHLGPLSNPKLKAKYLLPIPNGLGSRVSEGPICLAEVDFWSQPRTVWISQSNFPEPADFVREGTRSSWFRGAVQIHALKKGKLEQIRHFGEDIEKSVKRLAYGGHNIQKLYVNPKTGMLYVGESNVGATNKCFSHFVEVNPDTGAVRIIKLPYAAEDAAFDTDGNVYLRVGGVIGRFDSETWREIPWDYGEELNRVGYEFGPSGNLVSGLVLPNKKPVCFHEGGMYISPKGHLAVSCAYRLEGRREKGKLTDSGQRNKYKPVDEEKGKAYLPSLYPGRISNSTSACVHIWDRHGQLVHEDALPGMPQADGIGLDNNGNLFVMVAPTRVLNGKPYFNKMTETLMRFPAGKGRFLGDPKIGTPVPLEKENQPKRAQDLRRVWAKGAKWFYGGVGCAGFNTGGCACWHSRFTLDYFARSFAPEIDQYRVAVLDAAGNLIMRIGRYGNADDDLGLFHPCFVGTHTDKRLFIADFGNARIVSAKLGYHTTERVDLK